MKNTFTRRGVIGAGLVGTGALLLPLRWASAAQEVSASVVETTHGRVRGASVAGVSRFLGIPYGDDTANTRFQPPRPPQPWSGVRDCLEPGAKAPQGMLTIAGTMGSGKFNGPGVPIVMAVATATNLPIKDSEDCLVLNVFTPEATSERKRPVMVWLHGGGLAMGSGFDPMTDGSTLAARGDVVVVSLNHRLNAMGFLSLADIHDDFADSGNAGLHDIVLALQWVRDNIAAFGGDAGNVTLFGESGGGMKVGAMLGMAPAQGLFHKAIVQSGPIVEVVRPEDAAYIAEQTLAALGIAKSEVHKLQTLEYRKIIAAASTVKQPSAANGLIERTLAPVVDGRAIPAHPFAPVATAISQNVPLMIGTCKDECSLFMASDEQFGNMTAAQVQAQFAEVLGDRGGEAFEVYSRARPQDPPTYWLSSLMTDLMFRNHSIVQADRKAAQKKAPVFMYRVDYEPNVAGRLLRTPHGTDVPLMFGTKLPPEFIGAGPEVDRLSETMMTAWLNFARSGNPSQDALPWPEYSTDKRLNMIFDINCGVKGDPDNPVREFWLS